MIGRNKIYLVTYLRQRVRTIVRPRRAQTAHRNPFNNRSREAGCPVVFVEDAKLQVAYVCDQLNAELSLISHHQIGRRLRLSLPFLNSYTTFTLRENP